MIDWVRLNLPPTHYRSYGDGFLRVKWPNQQCQSTEGTHTTSGLETEWDYSGRKGRDGQKKKIGKANERKGKVKREKDEEVNGQGGRGVPRPHTQNKQQKMNAKQIEQQQIYSSESPICILRTWVKRTSCNSFTTFCCCCSTRSSSTAACNTQNSAMGGCQSRQMPITAGRLLWQYHDYIWRLTT